MPIRLCLEPRCASPATYRGRCGRHARARERTTHPNKGLYNSRRWQYTRRKQLYHHPMCAHCLNEGREVLATDVDHIRPVEQGGDPWSFTNLRSLCHSCHSRITRAAQVESGR